MSKTGWGKPKYGSTEFKRTGKPNKGPGNNFIRILPPMFSLAEEGIWAVYRTTHWGYAGVNAKDPNKPSVRPFLCIEDKDRRTGIVRQACPECDLYNSKFEERKQLAAELTAAGKTEDEVDAELEQQDLWLQKHGPERKWYLNVKYKDGSFGDYKINHKHHKKGIDTKISELFKEQEIEALDPEQGVWFNIKRTGTGWDTPDTIEVEMEMIEPGKPSKGFRTLLAPLSEEDWDKANKECKDLADAGGQVLTFEQIRDLTKSGGDPETVDSIMGPRGGNKPASKSSQPARADEDDDEPVNMPPSRSEVKRAVAEHKAEEKGLPPKSEKAPEQQLDPELVARRDAILAKRAADKAKADAEAKAKAEADAKAKEAPATKSTREMDDDEILAFFEESGAATAKTA